MSPRLSGYQYEVSLITESSMRWVWSYIRVISKRTCDVINESKTQWIPVRGEFDRIFVLFPSVLVMLSMSPRLSGYQYEVSLIGYLCCFQAYLWCYQWVQDSVDTSMRWVWSDICVVSKRTCDVINESKTQWIPVWGEFDRIFVLFPSVLVMLSMSPRLSGYQYEVSLIGYLCCFQAYLWCYQWVQDSVDTSTRWVWSDFRVVSKRTCCVACEI